MLATDRSIEWDGKRSAIFGCLPMVCVWLNTRKAIARLTPAKLHHPPRFGWYTRLDFILSSLYLAFFLSSRLCLNPRCRRDLNIAFMLHRVTRRCLLRKPSFFITWKFIARPLNRDEAKKKIAATIGRVVIVMMSDSRYLHAWNASREIHQRKNLLRP